MKRRISPELVAVLLLTSVSAFGCSSPDKHRQPNAVEPPIGQLASIDTVRNVTLPLDTSGLSPDQKLLDVQAEDALIGDCMKRSGAIFEGSSQSTATAIYLYEEKQRESRFGLVDESKAAQFGYHGEPMPDLTKGGQSTSSQAYANCAKEVKSYMGENAPPAEDFVKVFQLPQEAAARTLNDSRYIAMTKRWAACMHGKGYNFDSPEDAAKDTNWPTDKPTAKELQTATTDVKCKQEVDYLPLVVALRTAYENQLIEENSEALQRVKEYYDRRTKLVADILAGKK